MNKKEQREKKKKAKEEHKSNSINFFSKETNTFYQLLATKSIPTLRINGIPMHRFSTMDPMTDTLLKIKAIKPYGRILDTCMGLGYTAIYSAKISEVMEVLTIEKDSEVLKIAKLNEASKDLFENKKIKILEGDSNELIKELKSESFDCVIHDPPTFQMAPDLYSLKFHREIYRVLSKNGKLWHYSPEPGKMKGKAEQLTNRVILYLKKAGFKEVIYDGDSKGILAFKG
jgi:hypothetical protein